MYPDEKTLVVEFIDFLESNVSPWGDVQLGTEFNYQRGRTDIVAVSSDGKVIAIEAKLSKWKIALQQAYRNLCFADLSYVLLPEEVIKNALKYNSEFDIRGVGLCCLTKEGISIVHDADDSLPLQPWLRERALEYVKN